jgi:hypothetical protein
MRSGVLAFVATMAVAPAAAAQQRPTAATQAQLGPTAAQQLGVEVDYLMMLYAMQAMASGPPVPPAQADAMVRQYLTNGAQAMAVPTSGPAAAYFDNAGTALAQVTLDIGNRPTQAPEAGAAAPGQSASAAVTPTATPAATASTTVTQTPAPAPAPTPTATASTTPTATASPTATATPAPTSTATQGSTANATTAAPPPAAAAPVTIVQPVTVPVPTPAAPAESQPGATRSTGAAWAGVFAAGAALGALLVAIGAWLRPPRRTAA